MPNKIKWKWRTEMEINSDRKKDSKQMKIENVGMKKKIEENIYIRKLIQEIRSSRLILGPAWLMQ